MQPARSRRRTLALAAAVLVLAAAGGAFAIAYQPAIAAIRPPPRTAFDPALVARGATLAAIGDCAVCHTANLAGGRSVPTPFGAIVSTNITPDATTGIGTWSEDAFRRAMQAGVARDGSHLYPVLPYPHFTRATAEDVGALYAFLMTRAPVSVPPPPNTLPFPVNQRVTLAGWNLLFLRQGPYTPDPAHDAQWNRGAYLATAVGHCGACHTPHNPLGAEQAADSYAGGQAENWPAPALQSQNPAPRAWTEAALTTYLATGYQTEHGAAAGPMTSVTAQLARVPLEDVQAIAHYFATLLPDAPAATPGPAVATNALFEGACASCHGAGAPMTTSGAPSLGLVSSVNASTPDGVVNAILHGIPWSEPGAHPFMPAFADALTDGQVAELAAFLRDAYARKPAWSGLAGAVARARQTPEG